MKDLKLILGVIILLILISLTSCDEAGFNNKAINFETQLIELDAELSHNKKQLSEDELNDILSKYYLILEDLLMSSKTVEEEAKTDLYRLKLNRLIEENKEKPL